MIESMKCSCQMLHPATDDILFPESIPTSFFLMPPTPPLLLAVPPTRANLKKRKGKEHALIESRPSFYASVGANAMQTMLQKKWHYKVVVFCNSPTTFLLLHETDFKESLSSGIQRHSLAHCAFPSNFINRSTRPFIFVAGAIFGSRRFTGIQVAVAPHS